MTLHAVTESTAIRVSFQVQATIPGRFWDRAFLDPVHGPLALLGAIDEWLASPECRVRVSTARIVTGPEDVLRALTGRKGASLEWDQEGDVRDLAGLSFP